MPTQTLGTTAPAQDQSGEEKVQQLRELFADAPEVGKKALENTLREIRIAGRGNPAAANRKRRPGRRPSRQGLRVDHRCSISARRSQAAADVSCGCWAVTSTRETRWAVSMTCASCFWTTTRGCSSPLVSTAIGTPTSTTSWRRFPTTWTSSTLRGKAGRAFAVPGAKDYLVKHQITAEGWYVAHPDLTVAEIHRLKRIGKAVDEFLDKVA